MIAPSDAPVNTKDRQKSRSRQVRKIPSGDRKAACESKQFLWRRSRERTGKQ